MIINIIKLNKINMLNHQMDKETDKKIPDMSEVDFDTRLKVLLDVPPRKEVAICEESENDKNDYQNDKSS